MSNPFLRRRACGRRLEAVSSSDRLADVQKFNIRQCCAALEQPCLQSAVRVAIQMRLRWLDRNNG